MAPPLFADDGIEINIRIAVCFETAVKDRWRFSADHTLRVDFRSALENVFAWTIFQVCEAAGKVSRLRA